MLLEIDIDAIDSWAVSEPKPRDGEVLCCADGCGITLPRAIWAARSTEINDKKGTLKITAVRVWVSDCCRAGLFFYRDSDGRTRDCE